jgi:hypothetical protein
MSVRTSKASPGVNVHGNGDVKVDPTAAPGVNVVGSKIALTAHAVRKLYEIQPYGAHEIETVLSFIRKFASLVVHYVIEASARRCANSNLDWLCDTSVAATVVPLT